MVTYTQGCWLLIWQPCSWSDVVRFLIWQPCSWSDVVRLLAEARRVNVLDVSAQSLLSALVATTLNANARGMPKRRRQEEESGRWTLMEHLTVARFA